MKMRETESKHIHENLVFIHKNDENNCNGRDISSLEEDTSRRHHGGSSFLYIIFIASGFFIGFFCSSYMLEIKYKSAFDSLSADNQQSHKELQQSYVKTLAKIEKQLDEAKRLGSKCDDENVLMRKKIKQITKTDQNFESLNSSYFQRVKEEKEVGEKLEVALKELKAKDDRIIELNRICEGSGNSYLSGINVKQLEMQLNEKTKQLNLMTGIDDKYKHLMDDMKEAMSLSSLRQLNRRYGKGPHQVLVDVTHLWEGTKVRGSFTVELAPNDMMPYTVLTFLDMVSSGIYEGCSFFYSADHVLMVGDKNNDPAKEQIIQNKIKEMSFGPSLLYQEHNPNYPHVKMTLGFSSRQLGPSFYISKNDNTKIHGRRNEIGEFEFPPQEGEPCFGKVIKGVETVLEIDSFTPSKNRPMKSLVEIERITVLTQQK